MRDSAGMTDAPSVPPSDEAPDSLQALLRSKRKRQAMQRRRIFEVPGYDGLIGVKLRAADGHDIFKDIQVGVEGDDATSAEIDQVLDARRDLLVRACVEFYVRDTALSEWRSLASVIGDGLGPVRFDERLVLFLGAEEGEITEDHGGSTAAARFVVSYDANLVTFYMQFIEWASRETPEADDELVGESSAVS